MRTIPIHVSFQAYRLKGSLLTALRDLRMEEPNPVQKQVMRSIMDGRDAVVASLLKDHAERAALIMAMNEIAKEPDPVGTKILVLTSDDSRAKKALGWIGRLGKNVQGFSSAALLEEQESKDRRDAISAGPTVLVSAPEVLRQVMKDHGIRLFGLQMVLMENVSKFQDPGAVATVLEGASGLFRRVVQVARPNNLILDEIVKWVGDPEWIGLDPWVSGGEAQSEPAEEPVKPTKVSVTLIGKPVKKPAKAMGNLTRDPRKSSDAQDDSSRDSGVDATDSNANPSRSEALSGSIQTAQPAVLPETTGLHFAVIPDESQVLAVSRWIRHHPDRRILAYVIGPSESDSVFRHLREADVSLISVHSRLRRSTYEYRFSRFLSQDVNVAVIGGNLKSQEKPTDVRSVVFSYVPDRGDTFQEHLSRVELADSNAEVVILVQQSKLDEFRDWVAKTGYGFMLAAPAALEGLDAEFAATQAAAPAPSASGGTPRESQPRRRPDEGDSSPASKDARSESPKTGSRSRSGRSSAPRGNASQPKDASAQGERPSTGGRRGRSGSGDGGAQGRKPKEARNDARRGSGGKGPRGGSSERNRGGGARGAGAGGRGRGGAGQDRRRQDDDAGKTRYGLPKPSYEKLEHGKSGRKEEKKGLLGSLKRLFGG